jgi:hypothetical protein
MVSVGDSNVTPWRTPRELSEPELLAEMEGLIKPYADGRPLLFNFHGPPHESNLDTVIALDPSYRPVVEHGMLTQTSAGAAEQRLVGAQRVLRQCGDRRSDLLGYDPSGETYQQYVAGYDCTSNQTLSEDSQTGDTVYFGTHRSEDLRRRPAGLHRLRYRATREDHVRHDHPAVRAQRMARRNTGRTPVHRLARDDHSGTVNLGDARFAGGKVDLAAAVSPQLSQA